MVKIAPSILSADFSALYDDVSKVAAAGVEYLHIDVMDGHFVPNISFGPIVVKALRPKSNLFFDVHLMIENPDRYIKEFVDAGADLVSVHAEVCPHLHRTLTLIKECGAKAGVALNPATPLDTIKHVLPMLDLILIMTVNPGFGGQSFIELVLPKITEVKELLIKEGLSAEIEVDGGINKHTAKIAAQAGANVLVAGSAIFGALDIARAVYDIRLAATIDNK